MKTREMNVLIIDDSAKVEDLDTEIIGVKTEDVARAHIVVHRGKVLKNAFGSTYGNLQGTML